jgi:hypothetical protein
MLHCYINQFVEYCQLADFSVRSITKCPQYTSESHGSGRSDNFTTF